VTGSARSVALAGLASCAVFIAPVGAEGAPPRFQELVDATPDGALLSPAPGVYAGPVEIRRPIRIDGRGEVAIDAGGRGSVVRILTDGASLRGLVLRGSGENHDTLDAGVQVRGNGNTVEDSVIENCLFGVDLQQSKRNAIRRNRIRSKPLPLGVKGDAIRLWYSFENEIVGNEISDVRDVVVWYSSDNLIAENSVSGSRYALHFMYSQRNRVERNRYAGNMVGIFLMYSDGVEIRGNRITGSVGATGMGIGFKESSDVLVEANAIIYCARGIYLDISPYEPDTTNRFASNRIAYNGVGVEFHSDWHGNVFRDNDFDGNFTQVAVRGGGGANDHLWEGNRWDDYRGFDRDGDGRGDTPYELYAYADRIWMQVPPAAFFRGSPLFEAIDFLDRLAPFTEPTMILRDSTPRFARSE
jgi:nitrous oxidase accessory protein